jgi:hypothetical protein
MSKKAVSAEKAACAYASMKAPSTPVGTSGYDVRVVGTDPCGEPRADAAARYKDQTYEVRHCNPALMPPQYESAFLWIICAELELPKALERNLRKCRSFEIFGYFSSVLVGRRYRFLTFVFALSLIGEAL